MNLVEVKDFSFSYPECSHKVLEHVNLKIKEGTLNVVCGRSGCGKSTLMSILCGIEQIEEGTCKVNGLELKKLTDRALGLDLTVDDARYRVDAAVGHVDLHDLGAGHVAHQIGAVGGENRSCREECAGGGNGLEQKGLADIH